MALNLEDIPEIKGRHLSVEIVYKDGPVTIQKMFYVTEKKKWSRPAIVSFGHIKDDIYVDQRIIYLDQIEKFDIL